MFKNTLSYYHGTTLTNWNHIKKQGVLKPNEKKQIYDYWLVKGVYFVAENPFIALWYAWVRTYLENKDNDNIDSKQHIEPVVLQLKIKLGDDVVNLLCSDGHNLLHRAHNALKEISPQKKYSLPLRANFDSYALQLILKETNNKSFLAAFQEGESFQFSIHNWHPKNPFNKEFKGIRYGDHIELCFGDYLPISNMALTVLKHSDIVINEQQNYWKTLCKALTDPLSDKKSYRLKKFMKSKFYGQGK